MAKVTVTIDLFSCVLFKLCDVGRVASTDCFKLLSFLKFIVRNKSVVSITS